MKQLTTKAIVLKRTNFQEADRILTLLSEDYGKIRVIAKGVRKLKSKLAGGLELLSVSDVTYIVGRSEIYTLVSTRSDMHYKNIVSDIDRTMLAYELIRRINKLTEDHTGQEFFGVLKCSLESLNNSEIDQQLIESWFNFQLLKTTGHSPDFQSDTSGQQLSIEKNYLFDPEAMGFKESSASKISPNQIKLLRLVIDVANPEQLLMISDAKNHVVDVCRLSNTLLKQQLGL